MVYTIVSLGVIATLGIACVLVLQKRYIYLSRWFLFPLGGGILWSLGWLMMHFFNEGVFDTNWLFMVSIQMVLVGLIALPLGLIIATLYYPFSKNHPLSKKILSMGIVAFFIGLIIPIFSLSSTIIQASININILLIKNSQFFIIYQMILIVLLFLSVAILFARLKYIRHKKDKILANYFIGGYLVTIGGYLLSLVISPIQGNVDLMQYGPLVLIIWVGFIVAGAVQYKMVDIQVFISQILIIWAIIIIGVITFNNSNVITFVIDMFFLILFTILGVILIQSLHKSAQTKRKLYYNNRKLQRFISIKDNFLRMTTHQLRTPVIILEEYTKSLISKIGANKAKNNREIDYLEKIAINNYRLKEVMEDLTLAYAIGGNQFVIRDMLPIDIISLIESIIEDLYSSHQYPKIDVKLDKANQNYIVNGQVRYMELALKKIIENAYMFAHSQVIIRLRMHDGIIAIQIIDDGEGIDKEDMKQLYTPFTRGMQASALYPNGSGLGLYLAKNIITKHKGKLALMSNPQKAGVEVIISLPKMTI